MSGIVTCTILSEGSKTPHGYRLVSMEVNKQINKISRAVLKFLDGESSHQDYPISDTGDFDMGKKITIKTRYEEEAGSETQIFEGLVTKVRHQESPEGVYLVATLKDSAVAMTGAKRQRYHQEVTDDKCIADIVGEYAGLSAGTMETTAVTYPYLLQKNRTDWDYILERAELNGFSLVLDDGTVHLQDPFTSSGTEHEFEKGKSDIYHMDFQVNGEQLIDGGTAVSWDVKKQELTPEEKALDVTLEKAEVQPGDAAAALKLDAGENIAPVHAQDQEMVTKATGELRNRFATYATGTIVVDGDGAIKVGDALVLTGYPKEFNNKMVITGVQHNIQTSGWKTIVQVGAPSALHKHRYHNEHSLFSGLQIGVVADYEEDPEKLSRIPVWLPCLKEQTAIVWARLAQPEAGNLRGHIWRPEKGDEVVLGFLDGKGEHGIILGSLYNPVNVEPDGFENNDTNSLRGLYTKEGLKILLDDENKSITLATSEENFIELTEEGLNIKISMKKLVPYAMKSYH